MLVENRVVRLVVAGWCLLRPASAAAAHEGMERHVDADSADGVENVFDVAQYGHHADEALARKQRRRRGRNQASLLALSVHGEHAARRGVLAQRIVARELHGIERTAVEI